MTPSPAALSRRSAFPVRFGFAFQLGHGSKMVGERSPQFFLLMPCDKFDRCTASIFTCCISSIPSLRERERTISKFDP